MDPSGNKIMNQCCCIMMLNWCWIFDFSCRCEILHFLCGTEQKKNYKGGVCCVAVLWGQKRRSLKASQLQRNNQLNVCDGESAGKNAGILVKQQGGLTQKHTDTCDVNTTGAITLETAHHIQEVIVIFIIDEGALILRQFEQSAADHLIHDADLWFHVGKAFEKHFSCHQAHDVHWRRGNMSSLKLSELLTQC